MPQRLSERQGATWRARRDGRKTGSDLAAWHRPSATEECQRREDDRAENPAELLAVGKNFAAADRTRQAAASPGQFPWRPTRREAHAGRARLSNHASPH